jgi:predicted SnoaL-like aldol condensation-catalyzing enzyme
MKRANLLLVLLLLSVPVSLVAQVPPTPAAVKDQLAMLASPDAKLARNKKHVFDFWRIVYEGGHVDQAAKYMAAGYIQHNPNLPSGRDIFVNFFRTARPPKPISDHMKMPVVSITAEGDRVMILSARKVRDRADASHVYYITWFDAFRIDSQGLIAEHWDPSEMWVDGKPPGAEFFADWDN